MGLATSSSKESYDLKVTKHHLDLFDLFPYKTFGSSDPEVKNGKPHPDIFLVSAKKFPGNPKPEQVKLYFRIILIASFWIRTWEKFSFFYKRYNF